MSICDDLSPAEHDVLRALTSRMGRRGKINLSRSEVAEVTTLDPAVVADAWRGLEEVGALSDAGVAKPCTHATHNRSTVGTLANSSLASSYEFGSARLASGLPAPLTADAALEGRVRRIVRRTYKGKPYDQKPVPTWNSFDLAVYFNRQVFTSWIGTGPGQTNFAALRGTFARWRNEDGLSPVVIKKMIDIFVASEEPTRGESAWKSVINLRQRLYESAVKALTENERENITDRAYWTGIEET